VLPLLHGRATVHRLLEARPAPERRLFYDRVWNGLRWRLFFRIFFSRAVMGRLGRDPEFFRYVEGSVGARILRRAEYALTELPTDTNPYLDYILTGNFTRTLPDYLLPDTLPAVRARLDRLVLFEGPVEAAAAAHAAGGFDGFNLSDIFEYLPLPTCEAVYASLLGTARPGARFAYWNMLAPRRLAACFPGRVRALHGIGEALARRDRAFFYQAFVVDETPSREEATS
jgi:S-adenosylmethionine-diacylglycerol 3-amino-3-carboxypropyl transferase